jgi:hypothetical protein
MIVHVCTEHLFSVHNNRCTVCTRRCARPSLYREERDRCTLHCATLPYVHGFGAHVHTCTGGAQ